MALGASGPGRGFWTAYTLGFAALTALYAATLATVGAPPGLAARGSLAAMLPNALFGALGLRLARGAIWRGDRRVGSWARAVALPLALALASTAGWLVLGALDRWRETGALALRGGQAAVWQTLVNVLIQLALLAVGQAWQAARRAADESERAARADDLRARAELALLRSQLNPHFVLNTLHALLGLVRRDPGRAEQALERLGELLRFGLQVHQGNLDQVAFREEWAFVDSYLALEQLRLGGRLQLALRADPDVMDVPVPPFALQPLAENAITHAIAPRREGGRLELTARRVAGRLLVVVDDDGPGASEVALLASPRLGLRLLRERLAALYAGRARLSFEASVLGGLCARLDLPDEGCAEAA